MSPTPSKTRTLVTIALFWALYLGILYLASIPKGMAPVRAQDLLWGALSSAALLALTRYILRREQRSMADVGLAATRQGSLQLGAGLLVGLGMYGATMVVVSLLAGPLTLERTGAATLPGALLAIISFLALSLMEELGFRGYPLRSLVPAIGYWPAQLLVAVAFALTHRLFGWGWETIAFGVLPNALLFGIAATATRSLAFPVGLHAALNIAAWSINTKETPGIWSVAVPDPVGALVSEVATYVNIAIILAVAGGLWWLGKRRTDP